MISSCRCKSSESRSFLGTYFALYSKVSYRRGVWNSRGGWKKYQKLIVGGAGVRIVGGVGKN